MTTLFSVSVRTYRFALCAILILGLAMTGYAAPGGAPVRRQLLLSDVPAAVASQQATAVAPVDGTRRLKLSLQMPVRDQAGLTALIAQLYDPTSPLFHRYLSVDQFTARFAPTQADYDTVIAWAQAQGFNVTSTPRNRHLVDVEGSVATINAALNITLTTYRHPTQSRTFIAPDREPTVTLGVQLLAISGLDDYQPPQRMLKQGDASQGPTPRLTGSGPGGEYLPSDMRAAYYGSGPLTGAGQSVGIFSFDGYKLSDVQLYFSTTGTSSNVPINNVLVNGYSGACDDGGAGCDDGEQVLDIVNVLGMAPGITQILFYEGDSGPDIVNQMASDNIAKIMSCSWGSGDMGHALDSILLEFQAQGQMFANATGDSGSYNSTTGAAWLPPSLNPYTLQVGGTDMTTAGPGGAWVSESAWPDAGGGYYSGAGYNIPTWQSQSGVINATNMGSNTLRNDPDVAAEANFDNPTVSNGHFETGFGGTSFAAPRWSGYLALANEQAAINGTGPLGFVNPALYSIGVGANYTSNFHDSVSGTNGGFLSVVGYDLVTGWGSPNGSALIDSLAGPLTAPGFVMSGYPTSVNMTASSSSDVAITIATPNGFSGSVLLAASGLPSGVTAAFNPTSAAPGTPSTLTLTSDGTVPAGTTAIVTVTGTSGTLTQTATLNLLVGDAPAAQITPSPLVFNAVPTGSENEFLSIADGATSIPLTYTIAIHSSTDGSCTGSITWLNASVTGGTANAGAPEQVNFTVNPAGSFPIGTYYAEVCVATNDPTQPTVVVPVQMNIIAGPALETIFISGFESGENNGSHIVTFVLDAAVEDDQAGSALNLVTGNYHTWSASVVDNINLYDDGTGLQVYWYNDVVQSAFRNKVGGVVVSGNYAVLHEGAVIGPSSTLSRTVSAMTNWYGGVDGYLGIAFRNSSTNTLNYGYIHIVTSPTVGFPAEVLDYGFDNTGAAIQVP